MKRNNIMIAVASTIAGGIAAYFIGRKILDRNEEEPEKLNGKSHHLTNVFSKAKQRTTNH